MTRKEIYDKAAVLFVYVFQTFFSFPKQVDCNENLCI